MAFEVLITLFLILVAALVISGFAYVFTIKAKQDRSPANSLPRKKDPVGRALGYTLVVLGILMFVGIFYAAKERMESWQIGALLYSVLGIALLRGGYKLIKDKKE